MVGQELEEKLGRGSADRLGLVVLGMVGVVLVSGGWRRAVVGRELRCGMRWCLPKVGRFALLTEGAHGCRKPSLIGAGPPCGKFYRLMQFN